MDLPDPEIEPGSPALQEDSLPTELSGKPRIPDIWPWNYDINIILFAEQKFNHDSLVSLNFYPSLPLLNSKYSAHREPYSMK